jgi:hypothetical protein
MADSLVIANAIELLGNSAVSTNPRCAGAQFMLQPGFTMGAPQPTTDYVASLVLDGERPFGRRASNRTVTLPVWIKAPSRYLLAAAREVLEEAIDQPYWTLAWTRDPGPGGTPLVLLLDCFRALPSVPVYNTLFEKQAGVLGSQITISFPALPYGRSDSATQIAFASPVPAAPPPPPAPVVLDNYSTISSPSFFQSNQCVVGPFSGCWDPDGFGDPGGQVTPLVYPASFPTPVNLTGMTSIAGYIGLGSRWWTWLERHGETKVRIDMTLTDTSGNTISFSRANMTLPVSQFSGNPCFTRFSMFIPQGNAVFNYASVAGYQITITNRSYPVNRFAWVTAYLDAVTAYPASQTAAPVTRGNVYTLYGVQGTARAPVSMSFQQAATPGTPTTITATGAGNYTVPVGTVYLKVEAWGGGGAGATQTVTGVGGGGGGGEDAQEAIFPAVPAQVIPYSVGVGGITGATPVNGQATFFGPGPSSALAVVANGGQSAAQNSIAGGLGGAGSGNLTHFPGGPGRTASGSVGGGGGSSAGSLLPGNTPIGTANAVLTGSGNWTAPPGVTQITVYATGGGGGGGSGSSSNNGAGGSGGETAVQIFTVIPGNNYAYVVGPGGAGGVASGNAGSNGSSSTFVVGAITLTAHGGIAGGSSSHSISGPAGGTGSTAPTHFNGGAGGGNSPYTGGGGSSAGTASAGNAGNGYGTAGAAPSGGGAGGNGSGSSNGVGLPGVVPGGGGGGSYNATYAGGAGAAGTIVIAYPGGAPTNNGAAAPAGGGGGGAGGPSANTPGSAGTAPGGGGGGADSTGTSEAGGAGAAGKLIITPYTNAAFKTLIVHRPPLGTPKTFQPLVSVGGGAGVPNGATQYTMPQPVAGVAADFNGTYTIYLINSSWNGASTRIIFVTVTQWDVVSGVSTAVSTVPITITPAQITNGIVQAGVLTLPQKAVAPDNVGGFYTVSVTDSNTSDRFYDCIFLDSQGQTVIINEPAAGFSTYWIDEPTTLVDLGLHLGSNSGRPNAISVMGECPVISGVLSLEPADGDNQLFAYCVDGAGAPSIGLAYYPRWYFDRLF